MSSQDSPTLRLKVQAEADPGALARVLERFQNLNLVPIRVTAQLFSSGILHVRVDLAGVCEETVGLIAAKLGQTPCILTASWHRIADKRPWIPVL